MGGTPSDSDATFKPTQYSATFLSLPPLRPVDIKEIMEAEGSEVSQCYNKNKDFWHAIGIVPRYLEQVIRKYKEILPHRKSDEENISTVFKTLTWMIIEQYEYDSTNGYLVELALRTLSGLSTPNDAILEKYIQRGKVYINNGVVGLPLLVIDMLATKTSYIPRNAVADFITPHQNQWETFEKMCLKTMTARFNIIDNSKRVKLSQLFKGAHFAKTIGQISLGNTSVNWCVYSCVNSKISLKNGKANSNIARIDHRSCDED